MEELQQEEIEALGSIYDGDVAFSSIDSRKFQYKYGEDGCGKSFVLEVTWGPDYPDALPEISLDAFYNKHLTRAVKDSVLQAVKTEAEQFLGMPMTYTIFEHVKENFDTFIADQPEDTHHSTNELTESLSSSHIGDEQSQKSSKKEQLTKAQKRRMWDKGGIEGEDRPRGWNWVDVIRHLSQTGPQDE